MEHVIVASEIELRGSNKMENLHENIFARHVVKVATKSYTQVGGQNKTG